MLKMDGNIPRHSLETFLNWEINNDVKTWEGCHCPAERRFHKWQLLALIQAALVLPQNSWSSSQRPPCVHLSIA